MMSTRLIIASSGGRDSTAMALAMAEAGEVGIMLFTPTGNELPGVADHLVRLAGRLKWKLVVPEGPTLQQCIKANKGLPNWRMRWCTRMIKIEPCIYYLAQHPGSTLCVGLRADEELRKGMYGDFATYRYPLREWGWGTKEVGDCLERHGVTVPRRTDCAWCYAQRLGEWWRLWRDHPLEYLNGERLEKQYGHTFRSPGRDTWPAGMRELRLRFEGGDVPRGALDDGAVGSACRVCSL